MLVGWMDGSCFLRNATQLTKTLFTTFVRHRCVSTLKLAAFNRYQNNIRKNVHPVLFRPKFFVHFNCAPCFLQYDGIILTHVSTKTKITIITTIIRSQRVRNIRDFIWCAMSINAIIYFNIFFLRLCPNVFDPTFSQTWIVSHSKLAMRSSFPYIARERESYFS